LIAEGISELKGPIHNTDFYSQHKSDIDRLVHEITSVELIKDAVETVVREKV
jgi:hypothetical protein